MAQASGFSLLITSSRPRLIARSRAEKLADDFSLSAPNSIKRYLRPSLSPSTTPQPVVSLPGSIPKTRITSQSLQQDSRQFYGSVVLIRNTEVNSLCQSDYRV